MTSPKIINVIKENDIISLSQMLVGNKKLRADQKLKINETSNINEGKTDNFKNDQITFLHVAAYFDSLECFCFLLPKYKLGLRQTSVKSYFPLHYACFNGSREVASYILSKDPNQGAETPPGIDHHFLYYTVFGGDAVILSALFQSGADLENKHNIKDDPIGKAIDLCQIPCLEVLLKYEKRISNQDQFTPAMLAAKNCHPNALKILVRSPDDLTYYSPSSKQSVFSLIFYYSNGSLFKQVLIDLLRKYHDIRIEPPDDIITSGVCHWLCKVGDIELAELMVETNEVNINRIDNNNHTGPFHLSVRKDLKDNDIIGILKIIIGRGFKLNEKANDQAQYVIEYFLNAMIKRIKVIEFLLGSGAIIDLPSSKLKNKTIYQQVMASNENSLKNLFQAYHH